MDIPEKTPTLSDPASWADAHGDVLYRYALARVRDPAVAEDLVQEAFLAAFRNRESFEARASERTWLVAILKNKIVDHFRKVRRENHPEDIGDFAEMDDSSFDASGRWRVGPAPWAKNPETVFVQKEFWGVLQGCIAELPGRLADTFVLRELEEFSGEEVCKVFSITPSNLWVSLHRARQRLRLCLERNWFGSKQKRKD